jgi:FKBP-type peptidyl-prolyl cis-trans isomerase
VLVYVPSGLAYGAAGSPSPPIPPNSDLLMEVKINGVAPTFDEMQDMLEDAETHESGVEFAVLEEGEGTAPTEPEDLVYTSYAGYRDADGIFFDGGFAIFPAGGVIRGWQEMLFEMKPGEARVVRIPSDLAYGPEGRGGIIPPNATLLFYMKLHRFDEFGPRLQRLIKEQIDNQPAQNEGGAAETPADEPNADATQQDG